MELNFISIWFILLELWDFGLDKWFLGRKCQKKNNGIRNANRMSGLPAFHSRVIAELELKLPKTYFAGMSRRHGEKRFSVRICLHAGSNPAAR
jgi:hypothetical protein